MALPPQSEKPVHWVGSSKSDLLALPREVVANLGYALGLAQLGGNPPAGRADSPAALVQDRGAGSAQQAPGLAIPLTLLGRSRAAATRSRSIRSKRSSSPNSATSCSRLRSSMRTMRRQATCFARRKRSSRRPKPNSRSLPPPSASCSISIMTARSPRATSVVTTGRSPSGDVRSRTSCRAWKPNVTCSGSGCSRARKSWRMPRTWPPVGTIFPGSIGGRSLRRSLTGSPSERRAWRFRSSKSLSEMTTNWVHNLWVPAFAGMSGRNWGTGAGALTSCRSTHRAAVSRREEQTWNPWPAPPSSPSG